MPRLSWPSELVPLADRGVARPVTRRDDPGGHGDRNDRGDPVARSVLDLQRRAGNRAVANAITAQRQKGGGGGKKAVKQPPPPPKWLQDAQAIVNDMAKTDKLLGHVVLRKYSDLNKTLRSFEYGAWTNSATEIFIKDPFPADVDRTDKTVQAQAEMFVRFELQHEANHVHQFAQAGGPPKTWQRMLEFEREAYTNDLKFLRGPGKQVISDADVLASIAEQVQTNLKDVNALLDGIAKLKKGQNVERHLWTEMKKRKLIPSGSDLDPTKLYKQP